MDNLSKSQSSTTTRSDFRGAALIKKKSTCAGREDLRLATIPTSVTESMEDITELPPEFVEFSVAMKRKGLTEWKLPEGIIQNTVELLYSVVAAAYNGSMICLTPQCERANENESEGAMLPRKMTKTMTASQGTATVSGGGSAMAGTARARIYLATCFRKRHDRKVLALDR